MLLSSNNAKKNFDFIVSVFYFVVLLCKGSVFSLGGQEMRWFLLVLLLSVTKSTNNFSSYLEVLRIPCTSKEKLLMDNNSTQKSGHLRYSAPLPYKRTAFV